MEFVPTEAGSSRTEGPLKGCIMDEDLEMYSGSEFARSEAEAVLRTAYD